MAGVTDMHQHVKHFACIPGIKFRLWGLSRKCFYLLSPFPMHKKKYFWDCFTELICGYCGYQNKYLGSSLTSHQNKIVNSSQGSVNSAATSSWLDLKIQQRIPYLGDGSNAIRNQLAASKSVMPLSHQRAYNCPTCCVYHRIHSCIRLLMTFLPQQPASYFLPAGRIKARIDPFGLIFLCLMT